MVPFFHMQEQHDFERKHPETYAPTLRDQRHAISVLPGSGGSDTSLDTDLHRNQQQ
jgi:hypothetical protein